MIALDAARVDDDEVSASVKLRQAVDGFELPKVKAREAKEALANESELAVLAKLLKLDHDAECGL